MLIRNLQDWWAVSSKAVQAVVLTTAIVLGFSLVYSVKSFFQTRAYEKREQKAEQERKAWGIERQELLNKVAVSEALTEAIKQVVTSKKADAAATIKELERIEQTHEENKAAIEAGDTGPADAVRRELDATLCARGYKAFCPK